MSLTFQTLTSVRSFVSSGTQRSLRTDGYFQELEELIKAAQEDKRKGNDIRQPLGQLKEEKIATTTQKGQFLDHLLGRDPVYNLANKVAERLSRVNLEQPQIEVRVKSLRVTAPAVVGPGALPSVKRAFISSIPLPKKSSSKQIVLLDEINAILSPGRMTLLLGPPSSGKSILMKTLAGLAPPTAHIEGSITYNGHTLDEFNVNRTAAYVEQRDVHSPSLTVRETFHFANVIQGSWLEFRPLIELLNSREQELGIEPDPQLASFMSANTGQDTNYFTELLIRLLLLNGAANTVVGDQMVRGVSGGEKKRVTSGEMLAGNRALGFYDEISTGLDSSSTLEICMGLRNVTKALKRSTIIALLQPPPETVALFDDVWLMAGGRLVFQGPVDEIQGFLQGKHLIPKSPHQPLADFLQEVLVETEQHLYRDMGAPDRFVTGGEIQQAYEASPVGQDIAARLEQPYDRTKTHPLALKKGRYGVPLSVAFSQVLKRELILTKREILQLQVRSVQTLIMSFITATVFLNIDKPPKDGPLDPEDLEKYVLSGNQFISVSFYSMLFINFGGFAEGPLMIMRLPVFFKQRNNCFYPPWTLAMTQWAISLPKSFLDVLLWTLPVYFLCGYSTNSSSEFFGYYFCLVLVNQWSLILSRIMGNVFQNETVATVFTVMALLVFVMCSGVTLSSDTIPNYWIWGFWLSPLAWSMRTLALLELLSDDWKAEVQLAEGELDEPQTIGEFILNSREFETDKFWIWAGCLFLLAWTVVLHILNILVMTFNKPLGSMDPKFVTDEEYEVYKNAQVYEKDVLEERKSGPIAEAVQAETKDTEKSGIITVDVDADDRGGQPVDDLAPELKARIDSVKAKLGFMQVHLTFKDLYYYVNAPSPEKKATDTAKVSEVGNVEKEASAKDIEQIKQPEQTKTAPAGELMLLKGINGNFAPGVLTALMGASGAGKTTLMDIIAGRKTQGRMEGSIYVNGQPKEQETFRRINGYVEQNDIHAPQTTVYEALLFSARLRLPRDAATETVREYVEVNSKMVELWELRNALVAGLSIEQAKRLTIGVELVANPSVIFLDEPTSGLDARAASIVMRTIRRIGSDGRTVIATIHQPSQLIFFSFDNLLLMKRGGYQIFFGPIGKEGSKVVSYFSSIRGVNVDNPYNPTQNPADWMLVVSNQASETRLEVDFAQEYAKSASASELAKEIEDTLQAYASSAPLSFEHDFASSWYQQFRWCSWRFLIVYWRNPMYNYTRYIVTVIIGVVFGSLYWQTGTDTEDLNDILNLTGGLYSTILFLGVTNANSVQPIVSDDRTVFYRERASGYYAVAPYTLAQSIAELPYLTVQTVLYTIIVYFMIGFDITGRKFFEFLLIEWLVLNVFTYFGIMSVYLTPILPLASVLGAFFYSLWNLFAGFLISDPLTPNYWVWLYWTNPVSYSIRALIESNIGEEADEKITLQRGEQQTVPDYLGDNFGFDYDDRWRNIGLLCLFMVVFRVIAMVALKYLNFQNR